VDRAVGGTIEPPVRAKWHGASARGALTVVFILAALDAIAQWSVLMIGAFAVVLVVLVFLMLSGAASRRRR
jgi:hypothetical protein